MQQSVFQILKATLAAIIAAFVFVLAFTVVIQLFNLSTACVKPVNQVFKTVSVVIGGLLFIRGEKGLVKGAVYGVCAVLATYLLFSVISGAFTFSWKFILEILLGVVSGGITGILAVNLKKQP